MGDSPGKRLAAFRKTTGLNQRDFASSLGVSGGLIGQIEADLAPPSQTFLIKISERYMISADWILYGEGTTIRQKTFADALVETAKIESISDAVARAGREALRPLTQGPAFNEPTYQAETSRAEALRGSYLPIPWHPMARKAQSVPVALSREALLTGRSPVENLAAVEAASVRVDLPGSVIAVIDTRFARAGGPDLWCYLVGGIITLARVQFDEGFAVVLPADHGGKAELLRDTSSMLGRVVWLGLQLP